jgi:hypothetical protein
MVNFSLPAGCGAPTITPIPDELGMALGCWLYLPGFAVVPLWNDFFDACLRDFD